MTIAITLLLTIIGGLVYITANDKYQELGRLTFSVALLVFLLVVVGAKTIPLGQ